MGIGGLCPLIKELCELLKINYRKNMYATAKDKIIGVDGHGLLHRAACIPDNAYAIIFDEDYEPVAELFALWCRKMKDGGVNLRLVFDGAVTPGKKGEKDGRMSKSREALAAVKAAGRDADFGHGDLKKHLTAAANGCCGEAMVTAVMNNLKLKGLSGIIAPCAAAPAPALPVR